MKSSSACVLFKPARTLIAKAIAQEKKRRQRDTETERQRDIQKKGTTAGERERGSDKGTEREVCVCVFIPRNPELQGDGETSCQPGT